MLQTDTYFADGAPCDLIWDLGCLTLVMDGCCVPKRLDPSLGGTRQASHRELNLEGRDLSSQRLQSSVGGSSLASLAGSAEHSAVVSGLLLSAAMGLCW